LPAWPAIAAARITATADSASTVARRSGPAAESGVPSGEAAVPSGEAAVPFLDAVPAAAGAPPVATSGYIAHASSTNSGPASGSVAPPAKTPPSPCARTQYTRLSTIATPRKSRGRHPAATATPISADRNASASAIVTPLPAAAAAALPCNRVSHENPEVAPRIASRVAFALLLAPFSHRQAIASHSTAHIVFAPLTPSRPPGRSVGHATSPTRPYNNTAPGAPVSGCAMFARTIPSPSPNHHTISTHANEAASAGLTVRRDSSPRPTRTWVRANSVFHSRRSPTAIRAPQSMLVASHPGCPIAPAVNCPTKSFEYMNDWNCRPPSSSQSSPSTV
jgi:hypothetical protein